MRKLLILISMIFTVSLFAGDLINKDSKKYDIEIIDGSTVKASINGNTNRTMAAKKGVTIKIVGGNSIKVDFDGDVIIQNGQLSKK